MSFFSWLNSKLPFNNSPSARWAILVFIIALLFVFTRCAKADEIDFSLGREIAHGNGADFGLYYRHDLALAGVRTFIGTNMVASNGLGDQSNWVWAAGLESFRGNLHMGIGMSYFARTDRLIGQHADYHLYLSYKRWKACPITIVHYSDAGSSPINTGVNLLECEWKIR